MYNEVALIKWFSPYHRCCQCIETENLPAESVWAGADKLQINFSFWEKLVDFTISSALDQSDVCAKFSTDVIKKFPIVGKGFLRGNHCNNSHTQFWIIARGRLRLITFTVWDKSICL